MNQPDAMLEHRIRQRAYEIYQSRLKNPALRDWLEAEHEILEEIRLLERRQLNLETASEDIGKSF
jgi:Protein of unknown function (DUF2934)